MARGATGARAVARAVVLAAALAAGGAAAHPHGRLECRVLLVLEHGVLQRVQHTLVLDAASSAALADRVQAGADAGTAAPSAPVRRFRDLLVGLMRHGGWMLELRPGAQGTPVRLDDADARWRQAEDGRLALELDLRPVAAPADALPRAADGPWTLACRDPHWYWLGEFAPQAPVAAAGAACTATVGSTRDAAAEAAALREAAREAGVLRAEMVAPAALAGTGGRLGPGQAELRCDAREPARRADS